MGRHLRSEMVGRRIPIYQKTSTKRILSVGTIEQQVDYLNGGEEIELVNLTPHGRTTFKLPKRVVPVEFSLRSGVRKESNPVMDTVDRSEPDQGRFSLVWRTSFPSRRYIFEVVEIVAGRMPAG